MNNVNLEKDIKLANDIISDPSMHDYARIYPWTNEILAKYYDYEDLKDKKALCVTSSGDHTLHAILAGATYVDSFDKNPLAKYYAKLKNAMILTYDYPNFLMQFDYCKYVKRNVRLNELSQFLDDDAKEFWESILKNPDYNYNLLYRLDGYNSSFKMNCAYFDKDIFNDLKKKLENSTITYHDLNILNYKKYKQLDRYDAIFLSNVVEHSDIRALFYAGNLLNKNGVLYNHHNLTVPKKIIIPKLNYEKKIMTIEDNYQNCGVSIYRKK